MSRLLITTVLASTAFGLSGCASFGGNIRGSFDCRAPGGTCAPTSAIDAEATGQDISPLAPPRSTAMSNGRSNRMLRVVLAAYRDAEGRTHDARVVHVALPEASGAKYQAPTSAADIGKALARVIGSDIGQNRQRSNADYEDEAPVPNPFPLPDALVFPSPVPMADPGVLPPGHEGSGVIAPLHDRAPHSNYPQTDIDKEEDVQP